MTKNNNKSEMNRRDFIKITALAGSVLVGGKLIFDLVKDEFVNVKETRLLMGTIINLTVIAESKAAGEAAVAATFAELERQVAIFNYRDPGSPISKLNRNGELVDPPQELVEVLRHANQISTMTAGAFDVTVKPLLDLFKQEQPNLPGETEISALLPLVNFQNVRTSPEEISFVIKGMAITLDGIAKGYIVDAGTTVLKQLGFRNVYVEAGGDLMVSGKKKDDLDWKIGIQSPREGHPGLLAQIKVSDQAVATSGDYLQYYSADMRYHHIIDPRIGYSAPWLASVTAVSTNAMLSDALATSLMVLGPEKGLSLINSLPSVEAYLITKRLEVLKSSGFYNKLEISDM